MNVRVSHLSCTDNLILQLSQVGFVSYGCETWCQTLRGKYRRMMFENWVLMEVLGPKMEQVTEDWRKVYNEERHFLCF